ncbi:MAG: prepilin-type N-terminal cleavage/methylation domain-containing protein [Fuerstiella sp.]|nr:prepilin-type N-terminal cleavage/methylation domain-containing protein [Fuerstiella sp.]
MKRPPLLHPNRLPTGFTFLELLIVLAVLTGVMSLAVPVALDWMDARRIHDATDSVAGKLLEASADAMWMGIPHAFEYSAQSNSYRSVEINTETANGSQNGPLEVRGGWNPLPDSLTLYADNRPDTSARYFRIVFDVHGRSRGSGVVVAGADMHQVIRIAPLSGFPTVVDN